MAKITKEDLENLLKEYNINEKFEDFLFGYQLSKWTGFSPLASFLTKIFGISSNRIVCFSIGISGNLEKKAPVVLYLGKDISNIEFKKGIISHKFTIVTNEDKKLKYKISRYVLPYPWHNESVKRIFGAGKN